MNQISNTRKRNLRTWAHRHGTSELINLNGNNPVVSLVDLASNDYLGLTNHPALIEAGKKTMETEGVGAGASRFITGTRQVHVDLEQALSRWLNRKCVLLFPSGFQANIAAVQALADRHTPIIADRLIHNSLLTGIKASSSKLMRFDHNNIFSLEKLLQQSRQRKPHQNPLVITESLFSMEGTSAPLKSIAELCIKYRSKLLVDEAHALGIMGPEGKGEAYELGDAVTMISGTFGKAFGSGGAFLATDKMTGEYLIQNSDPFRYTTALAPPLCAASLAALQLIQQNPDWGKQLQEMAVHWRNELVTAGFKRPKGHGPIISLILGSDEKALKYQKILESNGLLTVAIRPPTVPEGKSRIRIVIRKTTSKKALNQLLQALSKT